MRRKSVYTAILLGLGLSTTTFASNVSIQGSIPGVVRLNSHTGLNANASQKIVALEHIIFSKEAKAYLATHKSAPAHLTNLSLPASASLGMNQVPVLDQGQHGTCVTFAVTGAMDAVLGDDAKSKNSDDHYSELCSLELGMTLAENDSSYPSGWDGSWGTIVLKQIADYGLVTRAYQKSKGCAGVYSYPRNDEYDNGSPMPVDQFVANSDKEPTFASYKILADAEDVFSGKTNMSDVLMQVKTALAAGHRVTFGTLLDVNAGGWGDMGALGTYKVYHDTWILTPEIAKDAENNQIDAGHEMIITGYNDNAVVKGPDGKHVGVLELRNSWGADVGDQGNYYMTYDHFEKLAMEAAEILPITAKK